MECEESLKLGAGPTGILLLNPSYQTVLLVPAACTVVFYDYFLTLGIEIKLVWPFPWCMAKVLYFATTYFNFISMTLLTPGLLTTCSSAPTALTTLGVCSGFITVIIAEAVLLLRTWVLWDKNNRIPIGLLSLFAFLTIPSTIFIVSGIREQHEAGSHPVLGSITFFSFLILAFYESIMLGLIIYKAKKHFAIHHRYSLFAVVLFRDGIMYYIILIVFSLTLTGFLVVQNLPLVMGLSLVQATLHSVLTNTGLLRLTTAQFAKLDSLFFTIGGTTFELTANAQAWPRSLNTLIGGVAGDVYLIVGDLGTPSGEGLDFINGFTFLERFYSVFDTTNQQVGLATTSFTDATTN